MPGHMNVLLAEADIPYDRLIEIRPRLSSRRRPLNPQGLKRENKQLREEIERRRREVDKSEKKVAEPEEQIADREKQIANLERQLAGRKKDSTNSSNRDATGSCSRWNGSMKR